MDELPNEVLGTIFKTSLAWHETRPGFLSPKPNPDYGGTPFLFTYVCSRWRRVAIEDPQLWSSVFISSPESSPRQVYRPPIWPNTQRIKIWFQRSGNIPLTISINFTFMKDTRNDLNANIEKCFRLFISLMPRWKRVSLHLPWSGKPWPFNLVPQDIPTVPHLRYLDIGGSLTQMPVFDIYPWILNILDRSPNLQILYFWNSLSIITSVDVQFVPQLHVPCFKCLRHLRIHAVLSLDNAIAILRSCTQLVSCSLRPMHRSAYFVAQPVELSKLAYLDLDFKTNQLDDAPFYSCIFNQISAPALVDMNLKSDLGWDQNAFNQFLTRSMCSIRHLFFHHIAMSADDVLDCLKANPALIEFRGGHPSRGSLDRGSNRRLLDALEDFDTVTGQNATVPFIEKLVLDTGHLLVGPSDTTPFALALKARLSRPGNRLQQLAFTNNGSHFSQSMFKYLISPLIGKEIQNHGLVIHDGHPAAHSSRWLFSSLLVCNDTSDSLAD